MKATYIPRSQTNSFTEQQLVLSENQTMLNEFIEMPFSKEAFLKQIELKSSNYPISNRKLLQSVLKSNYESIENNSKSLENINKLSNETCFTITTGHQLSLLTGPIYFIYKILHVIKQCEELNELYPQNQFVPVFWMASEDHDFEEVKSISIFGKTMSWETNQSGAVGRMNLSGIAESLSEFKQFFTTNPSNEIFELLNHLNGKTYGEAFFKFLHSMFASYGLVIIDGDEREFKKVFSTIMKKEIETRFSFHAVENSNQKLEKKNLKIQVKAREVNLFHLSNQKRERIIPTATDFKIGDNVLSEKEILDLVEKEPEAFSPNVILRPIYQEFLLPNLCYTGGVGELTYWLQLKEVFDSCQLTFPLIQARTSALWVDSVSIQKLDKFNLQIMDLFKPISDLKKQILQMNETENIDFKLVDFQFNQFRTDFSDKSNQIDPSLNSRIGAELARIEKQIENLKVQLEKSVKVKHEKSLVGIEQLKNKLFPGNSLQERSVNFFQFCSDGNYSKRLDEIKDLIQPFNSDLLIIEIQS